MNISALLDSRSRQSSGSHKTGEESREDVAYPKGDEFLRKRLGCSAVAKRVLARPSPSARQKAWWIRVPALQIW